MKLEHFKFSKNSTTIEKLIYFIVAITFIAPLMTAILLFFTFTFIGIDISQEFRYAIFGIFEFIALFSFLIIYS